MENLIDVIERDGILVLRLFVAMLFGAFVGLERQTRGRAAGLRTNILVCLGSAAIIVVFQKLSMETVLGADSVIRMDPSRAAAGVITGIGFLGAGTIVKSNDYIRGLTTAASIWVVSAIGVTVGLGEYVIAAFLTFLVLVALYVLHRIPIAGDNYFQLSLKWTGDLALLNEVSESLSQDGLKIKHRSVTRQPKTGNCEVTLVLRIRNKSDDSAIVTKLQMDERFDEVGWN